MFRRGLPAVVVATEGEEVMTAEGRDKVPDGHVAVWFGDPQAKRISEGGEGGTTPEVWTMPHDYFVAASQPVFRH
jgi:hypothetical protein